MLRAIAISALLTGLVPGVAWGAWLRPVRGPIVEAFSYSATDPYAAGRRRGIVLAAAPGSPVRAACGGQVVFAGSVGRAGPTISVQCGPLRATYQGITNSGIGEGEIVARGQTIARTGERGAIHLGARRGPADYADPATLLAENVPPLGRARSPNRHPPLKNPPSTPPRPRPRPQAAPAPPPSSTPLLAWVGLAAALAAVPLGGTVRVVGRRRRQGLQRRGQPQPAVEGS